MATKFANQVSDGMDVVDNDGEKIGTVHEVYDATSGEMSTSGGGYLRVPTGFLGLGAEHHIPFNAIRDVHEGRIHLSVAKDRLNELGHDQEPSGSNKDFSDGTQERSTPAAQTGQGAGGIGERKLQLREEELIARKHSVQTGEVQLHTEVVSEKRTLDVPVTREEVSIERHAVDRRPSDQPISEGETIRVPVREEQVTAEKQTIVYEEVEVGKHAVQETQHVSETVRREKAVINTEGGVEIEDEAESARSSNPDSRNT